MTKRITDNRPWNEDTDETPPASSGRSRAEQLKEQFSGKQQISAEAPRGKNTHVGHAEPPPPAAVQLLAQLPARTVDDFDRLAESPHTSTSDIHGALLKFIKGEYRTRDIDVALGTRCIVLGGERRWNKFRGSTLVETITQIDAAPLPLREELDDLDPSTWEPGLSGPKDPWVLQSNLFLTDPATYAEYTLTTSSWGGETAINLLARQVKARRQKFPGAQPIIELQMIKKISKRFGAVPAPSFPIVGWIDENGNPIDDN